MKEAVTISVVARLLLSRSTAGPDCSPRRERARVCNSAFLEHLHRSRPFLNHGLGKRSDSSFDPLERLFSFELTERIEQVDYFW
jgi:hypothetical protein